MEQVIQLYESGLSAREVKEKLGLPLSVRSVQRALKKAGVIRDGHEAFRLAVRQGKVHYHRTDTRKPRKMIPDSLRYAVFYRDNFRCQICGRTAKETLRLEADHINEIATDNRLENLQVLCHECNNGKSRFSGTGHNSSKYTKLVLKEAA